MKNHNHILVSCPCDVLKKGRAVPDEFPRSDSDANSLVGHDCSKLELTAKNISASSPMATTEPAMTSLVDRIRVTIPKLFQHGKLLRCIAQTNTISCVCVFVCVCVCVAVGCDFPPPESCRSP